MRGVRIPSNGIYTQRRENMKTLWLIPFLLVGCSTPRPAPSPSPVSSLAVTQSVPQSTLPTCNRRTVALDLDVFNQCIQSGMSFATVSNSIGYAGTIVAVSGTAVTARWSNGEGVLMATFVDNKLVSKAQSGLEACERSCQ